MSSKHDSLRDADDPGGGGGAVLYCAGQVVNLVSVMHLSAKFYKWQTFLFLKTTSLEKAWTTSE